MSQGGRKRRGREEEEKMRREGEIESVRVSRGE